MGTVIKREGRTLNINKEILDDQKILEVGTDIPENSKIDTNEKDNYESFKTIYKDTITEKCLELYGTSDDEKLWEDTAKEMFLKSANYVPTENDKVDGELTQTEIKNESKRVMRKLNLNENKYVVNVPFGSTISVEAENEAEALDKVKAAFKDEYKDQVTLDSNQEYVETDKFSGTNFEKYLPMEMRWKHWEKVNSNDLYWVTQEFFNKTMVQQFAETFKKTNFNKAYVTVRDLSSYDFEKDLEQNVLVLVNNDGTFDMSNYINKTVDAGYYDREDLEENKKVTETIEHFTDPDETAEMLVKISKLIDQIDDCWNSINPDDQAKLDNEFNGTISAHIRSIDSNVNEILDDELSSYKELFENKECSKQK